jgi:hypothetical protein
MASTTRAKGNPRRISTSVTAKERVRLSGRVLPGGRVARWRVAAVASRAIVTARNAMTFLFMNFP